MVPILGPAFEHLRIPPPETWDFTIYIGDHLSLKTPLRMPKIPSNILKSRGEIESLSDQSIDSIYNHHDGSLSLINYEENSAIYWVRSIKHVPWWVAGSPIQRIIGCWMRKHKLELTHAAAVGFPHGGVLLSGKSGAGKSTTALSCLEAGLFYASEDYCLVGVEPTPCVYSVYNSSKLEPNTLRQFPHIEKHVINKKRHDWEKALVFQQQYMPERIIKSFPLKAVLVLEITKKNDTFVQACSPGEALVELSASTIFQLSTSGKPTLSHYASLLKKIPCYKLLLGTDRALVAASVRQVIETAL